MAGEPVLMPIANSYGKVWNFNAVKACEVMQKPLESTTERHPLPLRPGYRESVRDSCAPFEKDTTEDWWAWGPVPRNLEHCLVAKALAQMGDRVRRRQRAQQLVRHSCKNRSHTSTGFMPLGLKRGDWPVLLDPLATEGTGSWPVPRGSWHLEDIAWHYTWFVPLDMAGFIHRLGSNAASMRQFQCWFEVGYLGIANEPDTPCSYLVAYLPSEAHCTPQLVRQLIKRRFGTDPGVVPGNHDTGALPRWLEFYAWGFCDQRAGSDSYQLGSPRSARGRVARIRAPILPKNSQFKALVRPTRQPGQAARAQGKEIGGIAGFPPRIGFWDSAGLCSTSGGHCTKGRER
jgi:putative alpha-1,2-mannosidase